MKRFRTSLFTDRKFLRRAGVVLIGLGLVLNVPLLSALFAGDGLLRQSTVVTLWEMDVALVVIGLVLAITGSAVPLIKLAMMLGLTALLWFGLEKVFYRLNHPLPPPPGSAAAPAPVIQEGTYTGDFFQLSELLGYWPKADGVFTSIRRTGDKTIYDVRYSIDAFHRRVTPERGTATGARSRFALFFGGSFTFGEGLEDDETIPVFFGELTPEYRAYNYGCSGYGTQQMLARLEDESLPGEVTESEGVAIYIYVDHHIDRLIGSMAIYNGWGSRMPYYTLDGSGEVYRRGDFLTGRPMTSKLYSELGDSEIARYFKVDLPPRITGRHELLAAKVIARARDVFRSRFGSDSFYVVIYPAQGVHAPGLIRHLEALGVKVLDYSNRITPTVENGMVIAGEVHPTGKANRIVAEWIIEDLGLGAIPDGK